MKYLLRNSTAIMMFTFIFRNICNAMANLQSIGLFLYSMPKINNLYMNVIRNVFIWVESEIINWKSYSYIWLGNVGFDNIPGLFLIGDIMLIKEGASVPRVLAKIAKQAT